MSEPPSVMLQARVPLELANAIARDIETLGLEGTSDAIREGLRLLHREAELVALGRAYDDFYSGPAPASEVTSALFSEERP